MSEQAPEPVEEYVDEAGNTWQLNATDAERLGYTKAETKVVKADDDKPAARRVTTK